MSKIRVLVLSTMYPKNIDPISGNFIHNQLKAFQRGDCEIKVISPVPYSPKIVWFNSKWKRYGRVLERDVIEGISVDYPPYIRFPGRWFHGLSCYTMYRGIKKIVDSIVVEFKPHVLLTYTATPDGYVGLLLKKRYRMPFICSLRGSDINIYPYYGRLSMLLTKKVISEADQLVSVSDALKKKAETIARPRKEIRVIYNGCDLTKFYYNGESRLQYRKMLGIPLEGKVIIFIGSLLKSKGVFELVNAFIQLNSKYSNLHLIFVGDGSEHSTINEIVYSKGLNKKVHLVGSQPQNEIPCWLSAANLLVLPTYYEGLPNVVLEAMACGLPVVATRVGGIPEAVENGKSGILIKKKDVNSLANAVENLFKDEDKSKRMGLYGSEIVKQRFSWDQNVEEIKKIYEDVAKEK